MWIYLHPTPVAKRIREGEFDINLRLAAPAANTDRVAGGSSTHLSDGGHPIRDPFGVFCVRQVSASDRCDPADSDNRAVACDPI